MSMLNTAVSGMLAAQRGLAVTSHNIANVNTPGYSRQVAVLTAREPERVGHNFIGDGVQLSQIKRVSDGFLTMQVRNSIAAQNEASSYLDLAQQVDNLLADQDTGLGTSLQNFFNSVQDLSSQPSSMTARQQVLSEGQALVGRFQFLDARMEDLTQETRASLNSYTSEVNTLAKSIADINGRITLAAGVTGGNLPNDLIDQRDQLIEELSGYVNVTTVEQQDHALNVFIGKGQPLVLSTRASQLGVDENYNGHFDITLKDAFNSSIITDNISGGKLSGSLNFINNMLEPVRNSLGRLAYGLVQGFNAQHQLGLTMDGSLNQDFFSIGGASVIPLSGALNNVSATVTNPGQLSNSDYTLVYNGADNYSLVRQSDNQTTTINTGGSYPYASASIDGFTITIGAAAGAVGDRYIIQPSRDGAGSIGMVIDDPAKIATAGPLRGREATNSSGGPANLGDADLSQLAVTSTAGLPLSSSITMTFDAVANQFILSMPPGGSLAYNPQTEGAGKQFTIPAVGNASFVISGRPADGDQFVLENNANADGDNRNALELTALQSAPVMLNGTASYMDSYGSLVADVGTNTRQQQISNTALNSLYQQSVQARDSMSGVNLEEEAGNLLTYQQAFQAAAKMISVSETIFQSLIGAFR